MDLVWPLLGVALIVVGLVDLFLAVLHHDAVAFLTPMLYRWTWVVVRTVTRPLPGNLSGMLRSLAGPGMVVLTAVVWLGTQAVGFALVYYPGLLGDGIVADNGVGRSFYGALTFSAATLVSLSFNDFTLNTVGYHAIAAAQTSVGLGIITLSISYVLSVYNLLQDQNALAAALHHQAEDGGDPRTILAPHFVDGQPSGLSTHLREFHRSLVDQAEGLRRYPILYYFKSRLSYRSIPYVFHMIGGVIAALRWGLPKDHPATEDPWLPSLLTGYRSVMHEVEAHFLPRRVLADPDPVPFDEFRAALADGETSDERLAEFCDLDRFMRRVAELDGPSDPEEAYERYCDWLPFATESADLVTALSEDLGTDIGEVTAEPEDARF